MLRHTSKVKTKAHHNLHHILEKSKPLLSSRDYLYRNELIDLFGANYAICDLPENFSCARIETIVYDKDFLIIGEYGRPGKRIAFVNQQSCTVNPFYNVDSSVRHIHAIYRIPHSNDVIVTTGDTSKYLDYWMLQDQKIVFNKRVKRALAGHTAVISVRGALYLGSDFSNRPNYIEKWDGKKYLFPEPANKMYVLRFKKYLDRYIISLNKELPCFGGRYTISIFDTKQEEFVYCDYRAKVLSQKSKTAGAHAEITLRSMTASEISCYLHK